MRDVTIAGAARKTQSVSSDAALTTAGTYIEMTSRLTEPVLPGLALLAVRNRVKR